MSSYRIVYAVPTAGGFQRITSIEVTAGEVKDTLREVKALEGQGYKLVRVDRKREGLFEDFETIRTF